MESYKGKPPVQIMYNQNASSYSFKIGIFEIKSDSRNLFNLNLNQLPEIDLQELPIDCKYILYDETIEDIPYLVNIKVILEKPGEAVYYLYFEESSRRSRWYYGDKMKEYFDSKLRALLERQQNVFDIVLGNHLLTESYFYLPYSFTFDEYTSTQILDLINATIIAVHNFSENLDPAPE